MSKKKPAKNYIILSIIYLGVIVLVFYFSKWYQTFREYQKQIPVIRGVLQEVDTLEVEHYLQEEPNAILYLCTAVEDKCRNFENDFRYIVKKKGLDSVIVYVNLSDEDDVEKYVSSFGSKYGSSLRGDSYPMLLEFEDGVIQDQAVDLTEATASAFLERKTTR